eukprot:XP_001703434.1 predicted protein [Chlamydomonas reinhardtii]
MAPSYASPALGWAWAQPLVLLGSEGAALSSATHLQAVAHGSAATASGSAATAPRSRVLCVGCEGGSLGVWRLRGAGHSVAWACGRVALAGEGVPPPARSGFGTALTGDRLFVVGGRDEAGVRNDIYVYSLSGRSWSMVTAASNPVPPRAAHALLLGDLWRFDPRDCTWTRLQPTAFGRYGHSLPLPPEIILVSKPYQPPTAPIDVLGAPLEGEVDGVFSCGYLATVAVRGLTYKAVLFSPVLHGGGGYVPVAAPGSYLQPPPPPVGRSGGGADECT